MAETEIEVADGKSKNPAAAPLSSDEMDAVQAAIEASFLEAGKKLGVWAIAFAQGSGKIVVEQTATGWTIGLDAPGWRA